METTTTAMQDAAPKLPNIRQLPPNLINQIAAGEVIERPASVVKELVENSIDAGSHRIEVTITGGGTELIRISDDGCGMTAEQLPLAISAHATSKLPDDESLFSVSTLGFRGEALASIGSVSQMLIRSRAEGESVGSEVNVRGGVIEPPAPCGCPTGTVIEIRNLFFNTPVRHRFLKTAQTERGHIVEAFTRLALANPQIHFVLTNNDKQLYDLPATTDWSNRIGSFFGDEIADALIPVSDQEQEIRISGYVCDPAVNRGNNRMQYLFLNGRHIRDRSLQHALGESYRGMLMVGRFPICFLRLDMPATLIDVNVHPTKLEVRFTDSGKVYGRLLQTLRHEFLRSDMSNRVSRPGESDDQSDDQSGSASASGDGLTKVGGVGREDPDVHRAGNASGSPDRPLVSQSEMIENQQRQSIIHWAKTGEDDSENSASILSGPAGLPSNHQAGHQAGHDSAHRSGDSFSSPVGAESADGLQRSMPQLPAKSNGAISPSSFGTGVPAFQPFSDGSSRFDGGHARGSVETDSASSQANDVSSDADSGGNGNTIVGGEALQTQGNSPSVCYLGVQVHNRYLVTQDDSGMVVLDQHALHERILYERVCAKVLADDSCLESQRLLVPEPVSLTPAERTAALDAKDMMAKIGLEIEEFGGDTIVIQSYPAMLPHTPPADMLRTVLDSLISAGKDPDAKDLLNHLLSTIACKAAVKAGDPLTPEEITALLEQKDLYHDTHHCPHGRPTALFFSRDELDRMFGRMGPRSKALRE